MNDILKKFVLLGSGKIEDEALDPQLLGMMMAENLE